MKMRKRSDLPTKVCLRCGLPFSWRKKWERDWDQVKYCSDRCRSGPALEASASLPAPEPSRSKTRNPAR